MILWKDCQNYEKKSGQDMSKDTFSKNVGISVILDSGVLIEFLADTDYSSKILDLTFDNNSILLSREALESLDANLAGLRICRNMCITING